MKKPFIFILLLSFSVVIVSVVSSLLLYSDIDETKESVKNKIKKSNRSNNTIQNKINRSDNYKKEIKLGETVKCKYSFVDGKHFVVVKSQDDKSIHALIELSE